MRNVIVIGASAGGIPALRTLIAGLEPTIDAAIFVVQHLSRESSANAIVNIFQKYTSLRCHVASDGMEFSSGNLYFAPEDNHLVLEKDQMFVIHGAHENKYRPSIDVLFRSAAVSFGNRVVGVILTGMLEDGTSGMSAIKRCGGVCIVQDPEDAEFLSMPQSVLNNVEVDFRVGLRDIATKITQVMREPLPPQVSIPQELIVEANITRRMMSNIDDLKSMATHSDFTCPECGGGLWHVKNDPVNRYRCHTGHVYTENLLRKSQHHQIEESIWVSIRMLEEKANLFKVMASRHPEDSRRNVNYHQRADDIDGHVKRLKILLHDLAEHSPANDIEE